MPPQAQLATAGQLVRIIGESPLAVEAVTLTPGIPVTGTLVPEGMKVSDGPRSAQLTKPSRGKPVVAVTVWTPAATGLLADSITTAPPAGAAPLRVAVPVKAVPPVTLAGVKVTVESTAGLIVSVAVCVTAWLPVMLTVVMALTALVLTGKLAEVAPAGTVTLAGTVCRRALVTNIDPMAKS